MERAFLTGTINENNTFQQNDYRSTLPQSPRKARNTTGRIHAIGICNFEPDRLPDSCHNAKIVPVADQVEIHPYTQQAEAIQIMRKLDLYAPAEMEQLYSIENQH